MAQDQELHDQNLSLTNPNRRVVRRPIILRRRKVATIRLGGKRAVGLIGKVRRSIRVKWVKLQWLYMLRKVREYYRKTLKELKEASATIEAFQQRVLLETSFAIPVMGVSFNNYPSLAASNRPPTLAI